MERAAGGAHERLPSLRLGFRGSLTLIVWSYDVEALVALGRLEEAAGILEELFERARGAENPNAVK